MNKIEIVLEEFKKEFREKWGRFYYSDKIDMDWEKPEKIITKSGFPCIASDEIEEDLFKALEDQKKDIRKKIEEKATFEAGVHSNGWYTIYKDDLEDILKIIK